MEQRIRTTIDEGLELAGSFDKLVEAKRPTEELAEAWCYLSMGLKNMKLACLKIFNPIPADIVEKLNRLQMEADFIAEYIEGLLSTDEQPTAH